MQWQQKDTSAGIYEQSRWLKLKSKIKGKILSINISAKKGVTKSPVDYALIAQDGIENDAHKGFGHRQISLMADEDIEIVRKSIPTIKPGDFGENIITRGLELTGLKIGEKIYIENTEKNTDAIISADDLKEAIVLEVTQIGKECVHPCSIFKKLGFCIMPQKGIFCKVIQGGTIKKNDNIFISEN